MVQAASIAAVGAAFLALQITAPNPGTGRGPGIGGDPGIDTARAGSMSFSGDIVMRPLAGAYDTAPQWIRRPSNQAIASVYPTAAVRQGLDGSADIRCTLTRDGALAGCVVEKEFPAGVGFGAAARTLMNDLNLRPAIRGGQPVSSSVGFTVTYSGPGIPTGSFIPGTSTLGGQAMLPSVAWVRAPSYEEVLAAYPAAAKAQNRGGRVTITCTFNATGGFKACDIDNEEPAGLGFGDAARRLTANFQGPSTLPSGASIEGAGIKIPFTFSDRMLRASATPVTGRPALVVMPSNTDFGRAFPVQARRASVLSSLVTLECGIGPGGALSACKVAQETPAGYGFGDAALSLAPKFQVNPWSAEGLPVVGGRIRVPVKYDLKTG